MRQERLQCGGGPQRDVEIRAPIGVGRVVRRRCLTVRCVRHGERDRRGVHVVAERREERTEEWLAAAAWQYRQARDQGNGGVGQLRSLPTLSLQGRPRVLQPERALHLLVQGDRLPHEVPVGDLPATAQLLLAPAVQPVPGSRLALEAGLDLRGLSLDEGLGLRVARVVDDRQVKAQAAVEVSQRPSWASACGRAP